MRFGEDRTHEILHLAALSSAGIAFAFAAPGAIHLVQKPAMNKTEIVFSYSGDLWRVSREGGVATRLTSGPGFESDAAFSPDGKTLAFTGEYDGNVDVFTVPAAGGVPKRMTYHPDADRVVGWTPDGKRILFRSNRLSHSRYTQLYTVPAEGGLPEALPLPMALHGRLFARRQAHGLRAARRRPVRARLHQLRRLEALSRRHGQLPLDGQFRRPDHGQRFRAPIPTTSIPCGSATRSTSSPTATVR